MKKLIFVLLIFHISFIVANAQWYYQNSGTSFSLYDIKFTNSNTGWTCGDNGTILKTTNGGKNWILQSTEAIDKYLISIYPINENLVFCVGYFETILRTTNGGTNWITIQNGPIGQGNSYMSVFFLNESTGWIGAWSSPMKVMKTTNGGLNWIDYFGWGKFNDLCFKDSINGLGVNDASYYAISSNSGINWISYSVGEGNYNDISLMTYNKNIGFIVSAIGYSVRKTTNFGLTFDSVGNIPNVPHELYCSKFITENIGWAGGSYGQLYKTDNGGKNWRVQSSLDSSFIRRIYALNDTVVWACGGGGKIIHTTNGGDSVTAIRQISSSVPDKIELFQNYPNPFNPTTNIKYQIVNSIFVTLKVFDLLGREITTLVNEFQKTGTYEVKFDARLCGQGSNLPSGIYFYKLESGNLNIVKKMILIK